MSAVEVIEIIAIDSDSPYVFSKIAYLWISFIEKSYYVTQEE